VSILLYSYTLLTLSNSFDYNDKNGGTSFKARHPNWRQNKMMEDFAKWGAESFGESSFCLKENVLICQRFRGLVDRRQRG
jgi:hypothetical protein